MKYIYIEILMFLSSVPAMAGFGDKLPIRWGKISVAEFSIVPQGRDSAAPAIVLCDFGNVEVSNRTFYTRHTRIKILNSDGLKYASIEIPYQTKDRHDVFIDLRARTCVLENGRVVSYKVPMGEVQDIKINDRWNKKKFTFPHVNPGVIIEFRYTMATLDFEKLNTWYFQREIPTVWSEMRFQVPPPFVYLVTFENSRQLLQDEELVYGQKLQWLYDTRSRARRTELFRNNYLLYSTSEGRYKVWALNDMKKKIVMRNLPGLSTGLDGEPVTSIYPQVRIDLFESSGNLPRSFRPLVLTTHKDFETRGEWSLMHDDMVLPGYVQFRLNTWSEFNTDLLDHDRFGRYLLKNYGESRLMDSITGQSNNKEQVLESVFNYVRKTFRWNGEFSMYASQGFNDFIHRQTGSSAEINLILANMLRQAGIVAYPLLIRTTDRGLPERMYPVKGQFNHVIVVAEVNGAEVLLDATSGTSDMNRLNKLDIGTLGWIVRKDNPGWIEIFKPGDSQENDEVPVFRL